MKNKKKIRMLHITFWHEKTKTFLPLCLGTCPPALVLDTVPAVAARTSLVAAALSSDWVLRASLLLGCSAPAPPTLPVPVNDSQDALGNLTVANSSVRLNSLVWTPSERPTGPRTPLGPSPGSCTFLLDQLVKYYFYEPIQQYWIWYKVVILPNFNTPPTS